MSEEKTHWKKLTNPKYVGAHDILPLKEINVTISDVKKEIVKNKDGEEECVVCYFVGAKKPMILNKTNMKIIQKKFDTPYIEEWKDKKITVYVAKVKAFGEVLDALRIKA
tara:strand:+ start:2618 stop:2947 length:330 start_codon:yes stop_codon:yes gene_type:complete